MYPRLPSFLSMNWLRVASDFGGFRISTPRFLLVFFLCFSMIGSTTYVCFVVVEDRAVFDVLCRESSVSEYY